MRLYDIIDGITKEDQLAEAGWERLISVMLKVTYRATVISVATIHSPSSVTSVPKLLTKTERKKYAEEMKMGRKRICRVAMTKIVYPCHILPHAKHSKSAIIIRGLLKMEDEGKKGI